MSTFFLFILTIIFFYLCHICTLFCCVFFINFKVFDFELELKFCFFYFSCIFIENGLRSTIKSILFDLCAHCCLFTFNIKFIYALKFCILNIFIINYIHKSLFYIWLYEKNYLFKYFYVYCNKNLIKNYFNSLLTEILKII